VTETCDYAWTVNGVAVFCIAPPAIDIRWYWVGRGECEGSMCEEHWMVGCAELAADEEVVAESIQVRRRQ